MQLTGPATTNFRILHEADGLHYRDVAVDTHLANGAASADVNVSSGFVNPVSVLTLGSVGKPSFLDHTKTRTVSGSAALDDAVSALHALGAKNDVVGISLENVGGLYGNLAFSKSPSLYISGKPVIDRIGLDAANQIDAAARRVMEILGEK